MNIKDVDESIKLTQKELSRLYRHKAYLHAKEYRNTDSQQIAIQERLKIAIKQAASRAKIIDALIGSAIKSRKTSHDTN